MNTVLINISSLLSRDRSNQGQAGGDDQCCSDMTRQHVPPALQHEIYTSTSLL